MPKERDHGQGGLYWVPSRRMWKAVVDVGFDPESGKRLQKGLYSKTKDGAVKKLNAMLREKDTLGRVLDRSTRVSELADRWMADVSARAKPRTLANYRSNVRAKIVPALGRRLIGELTPADIRRLHTTIRATGVGDAGVSSAHRTLVTMLEYARAERLITENVAKLAPPRKTQVGKKRDSLSRDDARALLGLADARWTMGLLTGIRSGEARALRWTDVDLDAQVATLSWSLTDADFAHGCGGTCERKRAGNCPERQPSVSAAGPVSRTRPSLRQGPPRSEQRRSGPPAPPCLRDPASDAHALRPRVHVHRVAPREAHEGEARRRCELDGER